MPISFKDIRDTILEVLMWLFFLFGSAMTVRLNDRLERVVVQPSTDVDDQIAAFCTVFTDLRKAFDSKIGLSTYGIGFFSSYICYRCDEYIFILSIFTPKLESKVKTYNRIPE